VSHGGARTFSTFGSLREITRPLAHTVGGRLSRLLGVDEDLAVRLRRVHADVDPVSFRVRQLGLSAAALGAGAALAAAVRPTPPVVCSVVRESASFPRHRVAGGVGVARWQRHLRLELPQVTEQLGMLLSAGCTAWAPL
jgi:hypothetical protein